MPFRMGPWEIGFLLLISLPVYFIPTIITIIRHVKQKLGIIILNVLAGWTLIGWVIALVWSIVAESRNSH